MSDSFRSKIQRGMRYCRPAIGIAVLASVTAVAWWQTGQGAAEKQSGAIENGAFRTHELRSRPRPHFEFSEDVELPQLVAALSASDPRTRRAAVSALSRTGNAARPFVPALHALLKDPDPLVRGQVAIALVRIDRSSTETAAALARMLVDYHGYVRNNVSTALCEMGSIAAPMLLPLLAHREAEVRLQAVQVLQRLDNHTGEVTAALRRVANDSNPQVREAAVVALILGQQLELADVIRWMHDANSSVSDTAIAILPRFGRAAAAAMPDLVAHLESPLPIQLPWLLFALQSLQQDASPAIPALLRLLDSPVEYDVGEILETLVDIGAEPQIVVPLLVRFLNDDSPHFASRAGELLSRVDPVTARRQASLLVAQLGGHREDSVPKVLAVLRGLGVNSVDAVPQLIELLRDGDQNIRDLVCQVLIRIGPQAAAAIPTIVAVMQDADPILRTSPVLIDAAGAIGPEAAPVVPRLMEIICTPDTYIRGGNRSQSAERARGAALIAAANIGVRDAEYMQRAHAALSSDSLAMRIAALQAISIVGIQAADLLPDILPALSHADSTIRLTAAQTIVDSAGGDPQVIAGLVRLLEDGDPEVRAAAATSLGRLGPAAAEAIPPLNAVRQIRGNYAPFSASRQHRRRMSAVYRLSSHQSSFSVVQAAEQALHRIAPENSAVQR